MANESRPLTGAGPTLQKARPCAQADLRRGLPSTLRVCYGWRRHAGDHDGPDPCGPEPGGDAPRLCGGGPCRGGRARRPDRAVRALVRRCAPRRGARAQRHDARHGRCRRPAGGAHGAAEGHRCARPRLLHQPRQPQGRRSFRPIPKAALVFWWGPLQRQVRFEGTIEEVDAAEADAYFASRPKGSQLAAWASAQSSVIEGRAALEAAERAIASASARTRCRGRRSGAATGWCRPWWSSGTAARAACTTGCAIPGRRTAGGSSGWRREQACSAAAAAPSR